MPNRATYSEMAFHGMVNTIPPSKLKPGDLVDCQNFLIGNSGELLSRPGCELKVSGTVHSVWSNGTVMFYRMGTGLYQYTSTGNSLLLRNDIVQTRPVSYCNVGDTVYYCDGAINGVIKAGMNRSWGLPMPNGFNVTLTTGLLEAGLYRITLSYLRFDLQQSGNDVPIEVMVPEGGQGGILINGITYPPDDSIIGVVVYVSPRYGKSLYRYGGYVPRGTSNINISQITNNLLHEVNVLSSMEEPPMGSLTGTLGGRVYIANHNFLYYSEPYSYEHFGSFNFFVFEDPITMIAPVSEGMFIGTTTATYWLLGLTPEPPFKRTQVAPYGVIKGTADFVTMAQYGGENGWLWSSTRGVCFGSETGLFKCLTEKDYVYPTPSTFEGAGIGFYSQGFLSYVSTMIYDTPAFNQYKSDTVGENTMPNVYINTGMLAGLTMPMITITATA